MSELLTIAVAAELTETEINGVLQLVADAEPVDQMRALNEAALLRLRRPHPTTQHLLVSEGEDLVGYRPTGIGDRVERWPAPGLSLTIGDGASALCCCSA